MLFSSFHWNRLPTCIKSSKAALQRIRSASASSSELKRTPLYDLHLERGGKMVNFAGYSMPVQYTDGIVKSHLHTRMTGKSSLFDVSHMGQLRITGHDREVFLESLVVADLAAAEIGEAKLSLLTNQNGGIIDDCVITKYEDHFYVVVNAGNKGNDLQHMHRELEQFKGDANIEILEDRALVALQGPGAVDALRDEMFASVDFEELEFMNGLYTSITSSSALKGLDVILTRCGYTGEDGFELSIPSAHVEQFTRQLLRYDSVLEAGLGARDSLRLEAGLCLHGQDITPTTTPIEATLAWTIAKRRREQGGFPGHAIIMDQLKNKTFSQKRVGFGSEGTTFRTGTTLYDSNGRTVGKVTSGTFSPCLQSPIGMAYIDKDAAKIGSEVRAKGRNKEHVLSITKMPFVPSHYYKKM
uniref:Aminomethyltransferase n=1 Tax=Albugo laibachii Nc14 TaxID=890382 RepID=F0WFH9_9STRA|nr:unnamed protein product [Albugo laibachii Nc14]|eukprot:CCA19961.1 unnamed protein product [Albugo laibachii Nc14]